MPSQLASVANDVRNIPPSEVLKGRGLEPHKEGNSTMWRGNAWAINVTGDSLWFDHKAGKGGSGAIDLVMHMENASFKEAVASLSGRRPGAAWHAGEWDKAREKYGDLVIDLAPNLSERRPLTELMNQYAKRDDYRWPQAFNYLTQRRCLPSATVNDLHRAGRIYSNNRGGIVFLHHDTNGGVGGATIKSTSSKFSQCVGNKTGAWFHVGQPPQDCGPLAITESPIDAISYSVLHPEENLCVVSIAGHYIPDQLLQACEDKEVIIAIDNPAFERSQQAAKITREIIATTMAKRPHAHVLTPMAKDWNDDLCAAQKRHVKSI